MSAVVREPESGSVGARSVTWTTSHGVLVDRRTEVASSAVAFAKLAQALDTRRGLLFSSGHAQGGGRKRFIGYADPPLEIVARGREVTVTALNARGEVLIPALACDLASVIDDLTVSRRVAHGSVPTPREAFREEERTRRTSVFSVLRRIVTSFARADDPLFGLYGAFGYDLVFQFETVPLHLERDPATRDMVLHLPDEVLCIDLDQEHAVVHRYDFSIERTSTVGLPRVTPMTRRSPARVPDEERDHLPGEYAALVGQAKGHFERGDLFEVVPGQSFHRPCATAPSEVFRRLRRRNPAPFDLLMNLGAGEHLVGASPETFVRVRPQGDRAEGRKMVESWPISGTIARGQDAIEDAEQVRALLNSAKEESELTMCTDVDRNDKARVCDPGTTTVVGRRQVGLHSRLIHTADHVQGVLREDMDALDAFLTHMWAVTVTGAPKRAAIGFLEEVERSPRRWYGGALGRIGFDGDMDTGLTLRTIHIVDGIATVRAGATLLHGSDPDAEERETELKASALLDALDRADDEPAHPRAGRVGRATCGAGRKVVILDHQDSFVHSLADVFRQTGATVSTYRSGVPVTILEELDPDLLVLSPGPGRPADFGIGLMLAEAERLAVPVFGVCLGLQAMVEHFGGGLTVLVDPMHGKASPCHLVGGGGILLRGLPPVFDVGRYHSLHADAALLPPELVVTARTEDGVIMAIEHRELPLAAVQFHPESIMSAKGRSGVRVIQNVMAGLCSGQRRSNLAPSVPDGR